MNPDPPTWPDNMPDLRLVPLAQEQVKAIVRTEKWENEHRCVNRERLLRPEQVRRQLCPGCATDSDY